MFQLIVLVIRSNSSDRVVPHTSGSAFTPSEAKKKPDFVQIASVGLQIGEENNPDL